MNATTNNPETGSEEELSTAIIAAMEDLPILARVEFVRNIIFDRGGDKHSLPKNATLIAATEILDGVIEILKRHRRAGGLRRPEP